VLGLRPAQERHRGGEIAPAVRGGGDGGMLPPGRRVGGAARRADREHARAVRLGGGPAAHARPHRDAGAGCRRDLLVVADHEPRPPCQDDVELLLAVLGLRVVDDHLLAGIGDPAGHPERLDPEQRAQRPEAQPGEVLARLDLVDAKDGETGIHGRSRPG
jgi:hypothetical protein